MPFGQGPLDTSYTIFSHIAFAQGQPWGTIALHTTGPLGFLRFPLFLPQTFACLALVAATLGGILALLMDYVLRPRLPFWVRLPALAILTWLVSFNDDAAWLLVVLLTSQMLLPAVPRSSRWSARPHASWFTWPTALGLIASAVAANVKGTFLFMSAILALQIAALELRSRRWPAASATFATLIVLVALVSGLSISYWGPYGRHLLDSLTAYPASFSMPGSPLIAAILLAFVFTFLALAAFAAHDSNNRVDAILRFIALSVLLWIVAKAALVRQDRAHEIRTILAIGVFLVIFLLAAYRLWTVKTRTMALLPTLALAALIILPKSESPLMQPAPRHVDTFVSFLKHGIVPAITTDAQTRRALAQQIHHPWAPADSIGVFGTYQTLALGYPGRYVPMPIVAPYEVWSPWTSRRELSFLLSAEAPDYLLYTTTPTTAEVALAMSARYEEVERGHHHRLLRRRAKPLHITTRVVFDGDIDAARLVPISPSWRPGATIAQIRFAKTLFSEGLSLLYQQPEAFLVLFRGPTPYARIRLNPLLAADGIVLSSRPGDWDGRAIALHGIRFDLLTNEHFDATALGFEARGPAGTLWTRYFSTRLHLRLYLASFE
jgi:hypothetical protein